MAAYRESLESLKEWYEFDRVNPGKLGDNHAAIKANKILASTTAGQSILWKIFRG